MGKDIKKGLFVKLHAKPGKEAELAKLLQSGLALVEAESGTVHWYAVKFDERTYGIFDVFADDAGRDAHLNGRLAAALIGKAGELLSQSPNIEKHDVVAVKS